jgi:hypothetical protein
VPLDCQGRGWSRTLRCGSAERSGAHDRPWQRQRQRQDQRQDQRQWQRQGQVAASSRPRRLRPAAGGERAERATVRSTAVGCRCRWLLPLSLPSAPATCRCRCRGGLPRRLLGIAVIPAAGGPLGVTPADFASGDRQRPIAACRMVAGKTRDRDRGSAWVDGRSGRGGATTAGR